MEVKPISFDLAKEWVISKHYAMRTPVIRYSFGLFIESKCVGVVTYGSPSSPAVAESICEPQWKDKVLELNRLVIDCKQPNSASFLVGNSLKLLPMPSIVVSYADGGMGHVGYVYQATNFYYAGTKTAHDNEYIVEGKKVHARTLSSRGITAPIKWAIENNIEIIKPKPKNRYVFIVSSKKDKREILKSIKWPLSFNYPKGESQRYDIEVLKSQEIRGVSVKRDTPVPTGEAVQSRNPAPISKPGREPKIISDKPIILDALSEYPRGTMVAITLPEKPIYSGNKSDFVRGIGPIPSQIMFIGEAPEQEEDDSGLLLVGRVGRYMDDCFVESGIERKQVYITNLVKEHPPQNRVPTDKEIRIYAPTIIQEIKKVQPKVIVLLGATALKAVLGMSGITKIHGQIFNSQEFNCKIIPIFKPSYVMRKAKDPAVPADFDPAVRQKFINDLIRIRKFVEGGAISETRKPTTYLLVDTLEKFDALMGKLNKAECVDFDLETTSKDPKTGKIICIAFSINEYRAAVLPLFVDGKNYWKESDHDSIMRQLQGFFYSDIPKCAHAGALIDIPFVRHHIGDIRHYDYDTIIMDYLLDENKKLSQRGLKELAWEHTDMGGYDAELEEIKDLLIGAKRKEYLKVRKEWKEAGEDPDTEPEKPEISFSQIPFEKLWPYAAADADVCGRLRRLFYTKLEKQELLPLLKKIMMPAQIILTEMEQRGVKIDLERLDAIRKEYEELAKEIDLQLQSHPDTLRAKQELGLEEVNFASAPQVQKILFDVLKITPTKRSKKTGKPSADKEVLEELAKTHEIPRLLNQKRGYEHAVKTYGENFRKSITEDDRVHTNYLIYSVETGRLASRRPNLQNISRPGEDERSDISAKIRDIFVAEEGNILVDIDASQIEWRLLANYSQDPRMVREIIDKVDAHTDTANLVSNVIGRKVSRQEGKGANYALIYGATGYRLANLFGVDEEVGEEIKDAIFSKYPKAKRFEESMRMFARTNGYVKNIFGRRRRLPGIISDDKKIRGHAERSAVNSPIQGLAGDVIYAVMIRLQKIWDENPDVWLTMQVHDSLVHECPKERAEFVIANVYKEMTRPLPGITIPLDAEVKIGSSLGNLTKLKEEEIKSIIERQNNL